MKVITINLPEKYLAAIQMLNDMGKYPSRSEVIRIALHNFLTSEYRMYKDLDPRIFKMIIRSKGDGKKTRFKKGHNNKERWGKSE